MSIKDNKHVDDISCQTNINPISFFGDENKNNINQEIPFDIESIKITENVLFTTEELKEMENEN